jgi:uncharacterized protein (TIGR00255 family)
MMVSMTGFGKATCEVDGKLIAIEIKSLNSKQLDIYTRLPNLYKDKDIEIRNIISSKLKRGKIDFSISFDNADSSNSSKINFALVKDYYDQMKDIESKLGIVGDGATLINTIMRFPDVMKTGKEELDETEWNKVTNKVNEALEMVECFRNQEGLALEKDILSRIQLIEDFLIAIQPYEEERMQKLREKITNGFDDIIDKEKIDSNRFEQEMIFYLERLDITEEKVRLKNHCSFFRDVSKDEDQAGKKLSFIAQEIGREINTIGSKANHSDIQRIVIQMKDELEKIKEQLMNVL